ncbi:hypothetical protein IJJ53_00205 [Candidatus Saccharibacteria bacterium]|nr:hypothetical protein [Candidatus Saccharibacteria bacterium]
MNEHKDKKESEFIGKLLVGAVLSLPIIIILYNLLTNLHNIQFINGIVYVLPYICLAYYIVISIIIASKKYGRSKKTADDKSLLTCRIFWAFLFPFLVMQFIVLISAALTMYNCSGSQCSGAEAILIFPFTAVCTVLLCFLGAKISKIKKQKSKRPKMI